MSNEIIVAIKEMMSLVVAILYLLLSRYRAKENKKYADENARNVKLLKMRLLKTYILKGLSIVILLGIIANLIDSFIAFYILTPLLIVLNLIFFGSTDWMCGFITFIKGVYNVGVTIISMVEFLLKIEDVGVIALGFTLSLAIFESATALSEGYSKMHEVKSLCNKK